LSIVGWACVASTLALIALPVAIATQCLVAAPGAPPEGPPESPVVIAAKAPIAGSYSRPAGATYLALPEWFVADSAEEYARSIQSGHPSAFPYFHAVTEYWAYYRGISRAECPAVPFDPGNHLMLGVVGASFTAEHVLKGMYENSIGRLTERFASADTDEDRFAAQTAQEYGRFMRTARWYQFPFSSKISGLWQLPLGGAHPLRKWERRAALTTEYAVKAVYGSLVSAAASSGYGEDDRQTFVMAEHLPASLPAPDVRRVSAAGTGVWILALPRYEKFTPAAVSLVSSGARLLEIAGNHRVLVTAVGNRATSWNDSGSRLLFARDLTSAPGRSRIAIDADVSALGEVLDALTRSGASLEHIYDY